MDIQQKLPNPLQALLPHTLLHYAKGEYIYLPDDPSVNIYVLTRGLIKVGSYSSAGKEVMSDCIFPSEFFGNLKYLPGDFFNEYARALVDVDVLEVNVNFFKELIVKDAAVADWFHTIATLRWYRAESRLFRIASEKPRDRIRHLLPLLHQRIDNPAGCAVSLLNLLSYQDVADLSGLSRQSAARFLKELTTKGAVSA